MDNYALEAQDCKKTVPWLCELKILSETMVFVRYGYFEPCWVPPVWSINLITPPSLVKHSNKIEVSPINSHHSAVNHPPKKLPRLTWLLPSVGTPCWVFFLWHEKTTKTSHQIQARTTKGATVRFQKVASNWHKELLGRNEHQHKGFSYPKSWGPIKKGKNDHPFIPCHPLRVLSIYIWEFVVGTMDLRLVWWSSPRPDRWSNWRWLNDSAWRNTVTLASWEAWLWATEL